MLAYRLLRMCADEDSHPGAKGRVRHDGAKKLQVEYVKKSSKVLKKVINKKRLHVE